MKAKKSFNKKVKIKPKELTYESFLESLKRDNFTEETELPKKFMRSLTPKERAAAVMSFVDSTPYAAYVIANKNFRRAVDRFLRIGDKEDLLTYKRNMPEQHENEFHKSFYLVREHIVMDLVSDSPEHGIGAMEEAVYGLAYSYENSDLANVDFDKKYNELMRSFLIKSAPFKWQESKSLEVLFGDQK